MLAKAGDRYKIGNIQNQRNAEEESVSINKYNPDKIEKVIENDNEKAKF